MNAYQRELNDNDFENILDDIYDNVNICGYNMSQARILKEIDPIAFKQEKLNYECNLPWICEICDEEYNTEDEAEECCKNEK